MLKHLITYCLSLFTSMVIAQTYEVVSVTGEVVSAITGDPVVDGTIMYTGTNGVLTDSSGRFTIYDLPRGKYKLAFNAFGFDDNDTVITIKNSGTLHFRWSIRTKCEVFNADRAQKDIRENKAKLLLQSVIYPLVFTDREKMQDFAKEFGIVYYDFGDDVTIPQECLKLYNRTIFSHLDKKYGEKWRRKVIRGVVGYK